MRIVSLTNDLRLLKHGNESVHKLPKAVSSTTQWQWLFIRGHTKLFIRDLVTQYVVFPLVYSTNDVIKIKMAVFQNNKLLDFNNNLRHF